MVFQSTKNKNSHLKLTVGGGDSDPTAENGSIDDGDITGVDSTGIVTLSAAKDEVTTDSVRETPTIETDSSTQNVTLPLKSGQGAEAISQIPPKKDEEQATAIPLLVKLAHSANSPTQTAHSSTKTTAASSEPGGTDGIAKQISSKTGSDAVAYELGAVVHRDAQGIVYRARRPGSNDRLAMKVFTSGITEKHAIDNFQRAAETASTWTHAALARVYDYGFSDSGKPFVVTEELQGRSLEDILGREKRLSRERALRLFIQICDALGYISWTKDTVGDLSSQNIFITRDESGVESVKLLNIGLNVEAHYEVDGLPPSGARVGYASPERCAGIEVDERAAIYSVGCLLFESLSGRRPFEADNEIDVIQKHLSEKPRALFRTERKRDKKLEEVVLRCLEKNPCNRFQTFNELSNELDAIMNALPSVAASKILSRNQLAKVMVCFADCLIVCFAITVSALVMMQMVTQYNGKLTELRTSIAAAEEASFLITGGSQGPRTFPSINQIAQIGTTTGPVLEGSSRGTIDPQGDATVIQGVNIIGTLPPEAERAGELWQDAILKAEALHQPSAVLGDLHMRRAETFDFDLNNVKAESEYKKALAIFDKEGLKFEASTAIEHLSIIAARVCGARESGTNLYSTITPDIISRFKAPLERQVSRNKAVGLDDDFLFAPLLAGMWTKQGQFDKAEKLLKDALNSVGEDQQQFTHQWELADCLKRKAKLSQACIWYKKAFDTARTTLSSSSGQDVFIISRAYGDVLKQLGRTRDAEAVVQETHEFFAPARPYYPTVIPIQIQEPRPIPHATYDPFAGE